MRVYFGLGGAAIGLVVSSLLVELVGFGGMALILALVALAGVWQRARLDNTPMRAPLRPPLRAAWSNRHYVVFLPSFVLFQVGLVMMTGALPYYAGAILRTDNEGGRVAALTGVAMLGMAATIPIAAHLARRWTMRVTYGRAMLVFPLLALPGLGTTVAVELQVLAVMCLTGATLAGVYLFPGPLLADICDADAEVSGQRREGVFYGGFSFAIKSVGAIAPLLLGLVLLLGDDAADPLGVRLVGPAAALTRAAGAPSDFDALLQALENPTALAALDAPLAAARLRGLRYQKQLLATEGGVISGAQAAEILGITRQAVDKRRRAGRLLAVSAGRRGYAYPVWQFDATYGVLPGLERVLDALREHDAWMQLSFFLNPHPGLSERTPLRALRAGDVDAAEHVARLFGEHGAT